MKILQKYFNPIKLHAFTSHRRKISNDEANVEKRKCVIA